MSVAATITALQTMHAAITGINSAPTDMPSNLSQVKRPTVLVWPGEATWNLQAIGYKRQERTYEVRCYVQPVAQGIAGIDEGYDACVALLQRFGAAYLADVTIGGAVDTVTAISDRGISGGSYELTWAGDAWWGFVYRITVVEKSA